MGPLTVWAYTKPGKGANNATAKADQPRIDGRCRLGRRCWSTPRHMVSSPSAERFGLDRKTVREWRDRAKAAGEAGSSPGTPNVGAAGTPRRRCASSRRPAASSAGAPAGPGSGSSASTRSRPDPRREARGRSWRRGLRPRLSPCSRTEARSKARAVEPPGRELMRGAAISVPAGRKASRRLHRRSTPSRPFTQHHLRRGGDRHVPEREDLTA